MRRNPLYIFLLKAVLLLPLCLGLWYWNAEWFNLPPTLLSGWIMHGIFPWVESAEWSQRIFAVITTLRVDSVPGQEGRYATMVVEANPLIYSYGLPLFVALFLASGDMKHWRKLLLGTLVLVPFQVWGICFDILKQVAIGADSAIASQTGLSALQREAIVLCYQLGYLILPTLVPIALWLMFSPQFIPMLMLEGALQQDEDAGIYIDDAAITAKINTALREEIALKGTAIKVETLGSVVRLSGRVETQECINKATALAQGVKGVRSVRNELILPSS